MDRAWVKGEGFKIETNFSQEVQSALSNIKNYNERTQAAIESSIRETGKNIRERAQRKVPVRTGKLKQSIKAHFDERKLIGQTYTKRPTAHLMEYGAKESLSMPRKSKGINIPGIGYRKFANIPARRAQPFMTPAFEEEKPVLIRAIRKAVEKA